MAEAPGQNRQGSQVDPVDSIQQQHLALNGSSDQGWRAPRRVSVRQRVPLLEKVPGRHVLEGKEMDTEGEMVGGNKRRCEKHVRGGTGAEEWDDTWALFNRVAERGATTQSQKDVSISLFLTLKIYCPLLVWSIKKDHLHITHLRAVEQMYLIKRPVSVRRYHVKQYIDIQLQTYASPKNGIFESCQDELSGQWFL